MKTETLEQPLSVPEKKSSQALRFFLCILFFFTCKLSIDLSRPLWIGLTEADAITTPVGVIYFTEPTPWLEAHEQCHFDRIQEIGALAFYSDYISGGACAEEIRCGANPRRHAACTTYPFDAR